MSRLVPALTFEPDEELPDPTLALLERIAALVEREPLPIMVPAPYVDVAAPDFGPLLDAVAASRFDPSLLGDVVGRAVVAAFALQPDPALAFDGVVKELAALRKKMGNIAGGGGGGGSTEVALRAGPDGSRVSTTNPLPVSITSAPSTAVWAYRAGVNGGTAMLSAGQRVTKITAIALGAQGTFVINAGDTITLPYDSTDHASSSIEMRPEGTLDGPTITFDTNVDSWVVEYETTP